MTAISWKNPVNGDWSDASDWSTGTVPTSADDVTIAAAGPYVVTISGADRANTLTFNASAAALDENAGSLTMAGGLTVDSGFVSLNEANMIGSVALNGGVLAFGNAAALGTGMLTFSGGELLGTATETFADAINLSSSGTTTFAAAHGTTLTLAGNLFYPGGNTVIIGAPGEDGNVIYSVAPGGSASVALYVLDGTLTAGSASLFITLGSIVGTTIAAGATLDWAGNAGEIRNLQGAGTVTDSGATTTLTLLAANYFGAISGPLSLVAGGAVNLIGANTYSGSTTINPGASLQLGSGGATGSIGGGAIADGGTLIIDRNDAVTIANAISGGGTLQQVGRGVTSINTANAYTGGTSLSAGTLAIGNPGALGTGTLTFSGGELLGTATETFADAISLSSDSITTFAAAHGTTLTLTGSLFYPGGNTVVIGAPGQDGDVVSSVAPGGSASVSLYVLDGTLTAGNGSLFITLGSIPGTTIAAGATLDWAGNAGEIRNLQGAGTVTNSGAATTLTILAANFSGTISGPLSLVFDGDASLSGLEDYTGGATLGTSATVSNAGTYDIVSNNGISGNPANFFINNGLFEKTSGGGVSDVTSDFVNNGTIAVSSGSIQFSGGFTNNGVIHGVVSQSGGVTTIRAAAPNDFNDDGISDIFWRNNADDSLATWLMNGSAISSSSSVTYQGNAIAPDASWSVAGTGDFNGDGDADILWRQSTTGALVDWSMNGSVIQSSADVTYQGNTIAPDSSWSVAGTGDFNGDGDADILWRQSTTGALVDWSMNGSVIQSSADVTYQGNTIAPDSSWSVAGIGDFSGDGKADILWRQSTTGALVDWSMNGSVIQSDASLSYQGNTIMPDSTWSVAGIGDFNGDGDADILWRQSTTGSLVEWLMNGSTIVSSNIVTSNGSAVTPDSTWNIVEVGDFNGTNKAGILWQQSTTGTLAEWQMNGAQIASSNVVTSQGNPIAPSSSWQVQSQPTDFV